ncbi:MAG: hypothetical protein ACLRP9_01790 [Anaerovoracaceae bacterium]|nr:MAG TPA: hypothetical protein [Caudoviricetes sp.]
MDPQQELFTELITKLKEIGYDVYDGVLPPEDTPYPFIYLADSQQIDDTNKTAVFGNVYQTIHVWHNDPKQRGTVSAILLAVKDVCRKVRHTKNFSWYVTNIDQRILADDTTKQPLMHGVLDVDFRFS